MINDKKRNLRSFSIIIIVGGVIICALSLIKGYKFFPWFGGGLSVAMIALLPFPKVVRVAHDGWMSFSHVLGWINTRVLLVVVYFVVITPIALIMRLFGRGSLDLTSFKGTDTAWKNCDSVRENHWKCMY